MARTCAVLCVFLLTSVAFVFALLFAKELVFQGTTISVSDFGNVTAYLSISVAFGVIALLLVILRLSSAKIPSRLLRWIVLLALLSSVIYAVFNTVGIIFLVDAGSGYKFDYYLIQGIFSAVYGYLAVITLSIDVLYFWKDNRVNMSGDERKYRNLVSSHQRTLMISFLLLAIYVPIGAIIFTNIEGWPYANASNFVVVTLTTVGFGYNSPKTMIGRAILPIYSIFGLGLMAVFLNSIADGVSNSISRVTKRVKPHTRGSISNWFHRNIDNILLFVVLIALWLLGALVFSFSEPDWSYVDGYYFMFQILATVGYGDLTIQNPLTIVFMYYFVFLGLGIFAVFVNSLWKLHPSSDENQPEDVHAEFPLLQIQSS